MQSNLFTELSAEQQEVVVGGLSQSVYDSASFTKAFGGISQGAQAGPGGASTYGFTTAEYINTSASKSTNLNTNNNYYYYPYSFPFKK